MSRKKKRFVYKGKEYPEIYEESFKKEGRVHIRYYFINNKGNKLRAQEKDAIVQKYTAFKISQNDESFPIYYEVDLTPQQAEVLKKNGITVAKPSKRQEVVVKVDGKRFLIDEVHDIPKKFYYEQVRQEISEDRYKFAEKVGIPEIGNLPNLKDRKRYTLRQIGNLYFQRDKHSGKSPLTEKNLSDSKLRWKEFRIITGVKYIDEITKAHLNNYNAELNKVKDDKQYRPTWLSAWQKKQMKNKKLNVRWVKSRLDKVKSILSNASDIAEFTDDIDRVLKTAKKNFVHEDVPKVIVKQIYEKKHIDAIFDVLDMRRNERERIANIKWRSVILLSLNCAFTEIDIEDLQFDDIDFDTKELAMIRKKENTERYAVLWGRTIQAIQDYLEIRPEPEEEYKDHIFINKNKAPIKADNLSDDYRSFIKKVNKIKAGEAKEKKQSVKDAIPRQLSFKYLRKSSASSADRTPGANPSEVTYLMGHSIGIKRHYSYRAADLVGNVCSKIEQDYFEE